MKRHSIVVQPSLFPDGDATLKTPEISRNLHTFWQYPDRLSPSITQSQTAMRILDLICPLHWGDLPDRNLQRFYGRHTVSNAPFIAAQLIMLNERGFVSLSMVEKRMRFFEQRFLPPAASSGLSVPRRGQGPRSSAGRSPCP